MKNTYLPHLVQRFRQTSLWLQIVILSFSAAIPVVLSGRQKVSAAQLTSRSLAQSTTKVSATGSNVFTFTIGTSGSTVGSIEFEYCTTPLGTCTAPTGLDVDSATLTSLTGAGGGAFSIGPNTANKAQVTRTASAVTGTPTLVATFGNVVNPSTRTSFYVRITTYATASYTTAVDAGVVAGATTDQLTVNARVQERLDFCVGSSAVDDDSTSPAADCAAFTSGAGTTVDLGVIDASTINISPVASGSGGNAMNGLAMIRTNALNGAVISYFAEQNTSSGKLKVAGATCSGTDTTDQCFNSTGTTQNSIVAGTEEFGLTVGYVNTGSRGSGYAGNNLVRDTNYDGDGTGTGGFAWDDTGTADIIASSAGSSIKVIDDEALVLKFAATSSVTTPTGQYTVTSTYIATATF